MWLENPLKTFFWLPVQKLYSSCLLSGKALDDLLIKVRHASDEFLVHGEHSQSIKTILCHGVSQEGLDPLQSRKAPLGFSCCHGCGEENPEKTECLCESALQVVLHEKLIQKHGNTATLEFAVLWKQLSMLNEEPCHASGLHHTPIKIHHKLKYVFSPFRWKEL